VNLHCLIKSQKTFTSKKQPSSKQKRAIKKYPPDQVGILILGKNLTGNNCQNQSDPKIKLPKKQ